MSKRIYRTDNHLESKIITYKVIKWSNRWASVLLDTNSLAERLKADINQFLPTAAHCIMSQRNGFNARSTHVLGGGWVFFIAISHSFSLRKAWTVLSWPDFCWSFVEFSFRMLFLTTFGQPWTHDCSIGSSSKQRITLFWNAFKIL